MNSNKMNPPSPTEDFNRRSIRFILDFNLVLFLLFKKNYKEQKLIVSNIFIFNYKNNYKNKQYVS